VQKPLRTAAPREIDRPYRLSISTGGHGVASNIVFRKVAALIDAPRSRNDLMRAKLVKLGLSSRLTLRHLLPMRHASARSLADGHSGFFGRDPVSHAAWRTIDLAAPCRACTARDYVHCQVDWRCVATRCRVYTFLAQQARIATTSNRADSCARSRTLPAHAWHGFNGEPGRLARPFQTGPYERSGMTPTSLRAAGEIDRGATNPADVPISMSNRHALLLSLARFSRDNSDVAFEAAEGIGKLRDTRAGF